MDAIIQFCTNAERISVSTKDITCLKDLTLKIDLKKDEVYRSRWYQDSSCLFSLELGMGQNSTIGKEIRFMKTIEMFYPGLFTWRFNGKNIECLAIIEMKKDNLGIFGRYRGIYNFIRHLRKQLAEILRYRDYEGINITHVIERDLISTGAINSETDMYSVPILPRDTTIEILNKSNNRIINDTSLKVLNMKFWVREINPDYYKEVPVTKTKKYPLTEDVWNKYPVCIKKLCALPKKGNYGRFLLATFFLHVHNERDAKHQLDMVLNESERYHINSGNCKDQWRTIVAKGYPPPSMKTMIELGYAEGPQDCVGLRITEEEDNDNNDGISNNNDE